jgi:hypothetical protein
MLNLTARIVDAWRASRAQDSASAAGLFVGATTPEDMERLAERQREAAERAGRRWLLHPANEIQRKPLKPRKPAR